MHAEKVHNRSTDHARSERLGLGLVLLLAVVARAALLARPLPDLDGLTIPDDAYYCLDLARSIAQGHGPSYGGVPTNGFQPLFVLLLAPLFLVAGDDPLVPLRLGLGLLALADLAALIVMIALVRRHSTTPWGPVAAGLAWALSPYVLETAANGMETALATLCMVSLLSVWDGILHGRQDGRQDGTSGALSGRGGLTVGLLAGLAVLARIDAVLVGPALALDLGLVIAQQARRGCTIRPEVRFVGAALAGVLVTLGPWLAWSWAATGLLFPISGRAVRFMSLAPVHHQPSWENWYLPMLSAGADAVTTLNVGTLLPLAVVAVGLVGTRGSVRRGSAGPLLRTLALLSVSCFLAYTLWVFGPWFFRRYLFTIALALCVGLGLALDALLGRIDLQDRRRQLGWVSCLIVAAMQLGNPAFARLYLDSGGRDLGYMNVGLWVRDHFPAGTVVGAAQSGAIGYFAPQLRVINLDGVVSLDSYRSLLGRRQGQWIDLQGVQYIIGMQPNFVFLRDHAPDLTPDRLESQGRIEGVRSLYQDWYVARVLPR